MTTIFMCDPLLDNQSDTGDDQNHGGKRDEQRGREQTGEQHTDSERCGRKSDEIPSAAHHVYHPLLSV
jgi:hypothetical protein